MSEVELLTGQRKQSMMTASYLSGHETRQRHLDNLTPLEFSSLWRRDCLIVVCFVLGLQVLKAIFSIYKSTFLLFTQQSILHRIKGDVQKTLGLV